MFGLRADGTRVKGLDGLSRMTPLLMPSREGSTIYTIITQDLKIIDEFIEKNKALGITYTYRDIIFAIIIRLFKMMPRLNRFILNGEFYDRKHIDVSMMVHKSLRRGDDETAIKVRFTGYETIAEVKEKLDEQIKKAVNATNQTDVFTDLLGKMPLWMLKFVVSLIKFADRLGLLSDKFLMETSPMHSSLFVTDLKSIKQGYVYHHLYNFGNCGLFIALGKEREIALTGEDGNVGSKKVLELGVSIDERVADGLYFANVGRVMKKIINNLDCLNTPLAESQIKKLKTYKEIKAEQKAAKKAAKLAKKSTK